MNNICLTGRLCADPENRLTASGSQVARFTLAVDRGRKDANGNKQTDFIKISAWNKTAEFVVSYLHKGRLIAVEGSLHINSVAQADGTNRTYAEVTANSVQALDYDKTEQAPEQAPAEQIEQSAVEDDVPFS